MGLPMGGVGTSDPPSEVPMEHFLGGRGYFYGSYQSIGNSDGRVNPGREYFVGIHMGFPTSVGSSDQGSEVPTL